MTLRIRAAIAALTIALFIAGLQVARAEQTKPAAPANAVNVTVKYTGKGVVDADHRIWAWLFTSPDINAGSLPIAEQSAQKNGATITFTDVSAKEVYIAVAYDEKGGFTGNAPPPPGSPVAFYGVKTPKDKPAPVVPGAKAAVTIALSDTQRFQ